MYTAALFTYCSIMAITPGPNNLMSLYLGAKGGFRYFSAFFSGSMTGLFIKCMLCGLLNVILSEKIPEVVPYLKWLGAIYMLYLAYAMVISAFRNKEDDKKQSGEGTFRSGILLQVLNIKSWVAALSIFSVYVIPFSSKVTDVLLTALIFTALCAASSVLWCGFGEIIQGLYRRWRLPVSCVLAATLAVCAWSAIR